MSLRWHLCGVQLSDLWRKLGSADESLIQSVRARFDRDIDHAIERGWFDRRSEAEELRTSLRQVLEQAVRQGVPFATLEEEQSEHVRVAHELARFGQAVHETDSWDWKHGVWYSLHEELGPKLNGRDKQLLDWLVLGRPIFGTQFGTGWEFYTYFTREEATALRETLAAALERGDCPGPYGDRDFTREIISWLDDITGGGLDVWVLAE